MNYNDSQILKLIPSTPLEVVTKGMPKDTASNIFILNPLPKRISRKSELPTK